MVVLLMRVIVGLKGEVVSVIDGEIDGEVVAVVMLGVVVDGCVL
jgi:hypothetical protein